MSITKKMVAGFATVVICASIFAAPVESASPAEQVAGSLKKWNEVKMKAKGNYAYTVSRSSFSGFRWTTTIVVRSNKVVERRFDVTNLRGAIQVPGQAPKKKGPKWVEKGKDIGTHKEGAAPKTIDVLYAEAKAVAETKLESFQKLYVGFHKNGILKHCFYVDTRIADDAPSNGPRISTFKTD